MTLDALARQIEDDSILGTCDWGSCGNQQTGWARLGRDDEWLAICDPCRKRGTSKCSQTQEWLVYAKAWQHDYEGSSE